MSKMNRGFAFFVEILWLIFGVTALILAIVNGNANGYAQSKMLFIVSGVSFLMFLLRRYMRKVAESKDKTKDS